VYPKPHDYVQSRKRQTLFFTIAAAILSVVIVVTLIVFCYQTNHLKL